MQKQNMTSRLEEDLSIGLATAGLESRGGNAVRGGSAAPSSQPLASRKRPIPGDGSSAALADALSSSLACIAASANAKNHSRLTNRTDEASNHSSEESGASSSVSNSSGVLHHDGTSGPAVVTGTSSSGGNGSGGASKGDSDSRHAEKHHHHHYHHHGGHGRRKQAPQPRSEELNSSEDGYGLPVPKDDRLQTDESPTEPATVVAHHLPPPRSDSNSSGAESEKASEGRAPSPLLQPRREPGFHTIRKTFNKVTRHWKRSETDSSGGVHTHQKYKLTGKRHVSLEQKVKTKKRKLEAPADRGSDNDEAGGNGSSGSGTEGGYAGSASSNDNNAQAGSCSSSEESMVKRRKRVAVSSASTRDPSRQLISRKQESLSVSSEIADFSSGASEADVSQGFAAAFRPTSSPSITSSSDEQEEPSDEDKYARKIDMALGRKRASAAWPRLPIQVSGEGVDLDRKLPGRSDARSSIPAPTLGGKAPILAVGCDVMAHILTFLEPPGILEVLTMPLSKDWLSSFTRQPELWRVLCLLDPFKAQLEDDADASDDSLDSYSVDVDSELRKAFGKYRILYSNFVRCLKYLSRIKDDALSGRPPSVDYGAQARQNITANLNLQHFLARARGVVVGSRQAGSVDGSDISDDDNGGGVAAARPPRKADPVGVSDDGSSLRSGSKRHGNLCNEKAKRKVRYAHSALTQRLLGPSADGTPGHVALPWSCAIYSIVNWMVAFADVEGIQTMSLKVLPFILEDEQQRITAQRAGLTDIVLRGMVMFPNSAPLHTAAFHTLVLLARPLGGHEGMLFHSSMVSSSGIFDTDGSATDGRSGIAVMLDSMRRFEDNEVLQAMSCWSLVNIALAPAQKAVLVKLGGIDVAANAMTAHAFSAEVQFRALFALINLVIPSVNIDQDPDNEGGVESAIEVEDSTEKEMLDEIVDHVVNLVVLAMKNFCASEAIVNRACLVLHNLSLTQGTFCRVVFPPHSFIMH